MISLQHRIAESTSVDEALKDGEANMTFYQCTVNEAGPSSIASEAPPPAVYISLTDTAGSFPATWFYAASTIQDLALDVAIAAITNKKNVEVDATPPNPGGNPYTGINRIYLLAT